MELSEEFKVAITDMLQYFRVNALQTKKYRNLSKERNYKEESKRILGTAKNKYWIFLMVNFNSKNWDVEERVCELEDRSVKNYSFRTTERKPIKKNDPVKQ